MRVQILLVFSLSILSVVRNASGLLGNQNKAPRKQFLTWATDYQKEMQELKATCKLTRGFQYKLKDTGDVV